MVAGVSKAWTVVPRRISNGLLEQYVIPEEIVPVKGSSVAA